MCWQFSCRVKFHMRYISIIVRCKTSVYQVLEESTRVNPSRYSNQIRGKLQGDKMICSLQNCTNTCTPTLWSCRPKKVQLVVQKVDVILQAYDIPSPYNYEGWSKTMASTAARSLQGKISLFLTGYFPCESPTFSVRPRSLVGRATVDLIRRSWVRFPPRS